MADASDVAKVVEKHTFHTESFEKRKAWNKVLRVESAKSLKQRLQDSGDVTIHLELDAVDVQPEPSAVKCEAQPPVGSTVSEPITARPNDAVTSEKLGPEIAVDSTVGGDVQNSEKVELRSSRAEASSLNIKPESLDVKCEAQPPLSEPSDTGSQPALQTSGPVETVVSEPITVVSETSGPVIAMDCTVDPEAIEVVEKLEVKGEEASPSTSSPATSATALIPDKNQAELPQRAANPKHKPTEKSRSQHKDKEAVNPSSNTCPFDEPDFNVDDFVTVDEVGDDMGDSSPEPHRSSSSRQSSRSRSARQSSGVSSSDRRTSPRSRDSKRSASSSSSSSKSNKGSSSSKSSETTKSPSKHSASVTESSSSSSSRSMVEKTQQSKTKSPAKASNAASSGCSSRSSSSVHETERIKSAAAVKASMRSRSELPSKGERDPESAVAKSNHKVSAEGIAAKPVKSETKTERSSEMHPPLQGLGLELSQEVDLNVNIVKDQKESKEEGKVDNIGQKEEPMDDGTEDSSSKVQLSGPEGGKTLHEERSQVDEGKVCLEEDGEMEMDGSFQVLDSVTEDEPATYEDDSHLVQDGGSTVKQLSKEDIIPSGDFDLKSNKDSVPEDQGQEANIVHYSQVDTECKQAPEDKGNEMSKDEEIKGKMLPAESCSASKEVENPNAQIPDKDMPHQDPKDSIKSPENDVTEQETFEILDSTDDQTTTATEDKSQNLESLVVQISKEYIGLMVEEDTHQVIEPSTTTSKSEEKEKSQGKQERTSETGTMMDTTAGVSEKDKGITEETLDSVKEEPVKTERAGRRRSARGKKDDKVELTEASEKTEILDSVEDSEPTVTTRSTRGKRERTTKTQNDTTRRRRTPARELQEKKQEKPPKKEEEAPPDESTPSTSSKDGSKEDAMHQVFTSPEEAVKADQPATGRKRKRGRPKKVVKSTKKGSAALKDDKDASEEEQILDSVDEPRDDQHPAGHIPKNNDEQTEESASLAGSPKNEEEEQLMHRIKDSVEDDQPHEITEDKTTDETPAKEEASAEEGDKATCGTTVEEASEKVVDEETASKIVGDLVESSDDPPDGTEGTPKTDSKTEDKSVSVTVTPERENIPKSPEKDDTMSAQSEEKEEVDPKELVTADEAGKERVSETRERVDGKDERRETRPPIQEDESVDFLNPETLMTLDEAGGEEKEKLDEEQAEKTSGKRKHDDTVLEENRNFVAVDEVEEEEEKKRKTRMRGRAKRRTRQFPAVSKWRGEPVGLEPKRSRSQSPCAVVDVKLPPFKPNNPLGQEFMVPKLASFCNLCSVFCSNESTARDLHCSSQRHYDNLQNHYQKIQQKPSRGSTQSCQGSISD